MPSSALWPRSGDSFRTVTGAAYAGAICYFFDGGTTSPRTVYQDSALTTSWGSTVTADANGLFPAVFLPEGTYNFRVNSATGGLIFEAGPIDPMPQPSTTSGGDIDPNDYRATGDLQWLLQSGAKDSWVRVNGKSIGNAASGATERANADTEDLFIYLWTYLTDSVAAVSGGRGASAAVDYAANKTITLPSARGRVIAGIDDMGSSAAGVIQTTANLTITTGSPTATVASVVGLAIGQIIIAAGVVVNTTITNISSLTITMSTNATQTATVSARFSIFEDAQQVGSVAGNDTHRLSGQENAQHTHTFTGDAVPDHNHTYTARAALTTAGAGAVANYANGDNTGASTGPAGAHTPTGTISNDGGQGTDHNNTQPTLLASLYVKL